MILAKPLMDQDRVVFGQAYNQPITEEVWIEMHEKLKGSPNRLE